MSRQNAGINLQILIVKSCPDSLDYNELLNCDRHSYQIQECGSSSEALKICQHLEPDCILLNWESSKLTKKKFLEYLDKNLIPVVILVESENQDLVHSHVVKETLTKELLCFAIDQAIAQTALKRKLTEAELKLQESEEAINYEASYRKTLFNSSIDGIVILSKTGNIIEANSSFARMLGYELAEITTLNLTDFEARWTRSELEQQRNQAQLWANRFVTRHRRKDGSIYDVEISSNSVNWHGQTVEFCICRDISEQQAALRERKQIEKALEINEANHRTTLEAIPDLLLRLDRNGNCLEYIQPAIGSENYLPINQRISEVLPPNLLQNQLKAIDRAIATGEMQIYEHQFLKQNTMFYEEVRILAINDHEVLAIVRDITSLRKAEAFLELQNRFFRCIAIGDPLPDTLDLLLRLIELEIDDALCSLLLVDHQDRLSPITDMYLPTELSRVFDGITTDQAATIFGTNPLNLIDIGANPHWQDYQQLFRSQGLTTCWSVPINTLNGQKILGILNLYFQEAKQISIFPTIFEDKIIKFSAYVIGIAIERHQTQTELQIQLQREQILNLRIQQELSDRKAAEAELQQSQERLRQSEELLRLTIENTPNGICTFNLETQFLSVNQHICQMFGYSSGEMLKTNVSDLIHPDFSEILLKGIRNLYAGRKKTIRIENQYIHRNGSIIDAISRFSIVQDAFDQPLHIVASIQDITKQKHIEIALDQRMERQSFLMMITQQIRQSLNLDQVVGNAVNEVKRLLDCHQVAIVQLFPEGAIQIIKDEIDPVYASILNFDYLDLDFFSQRLDFFISANTLILNDVAEGVLFDNQTKIDSFQSRLIAPIVQHIKDPDQNLKWSKNENQLWGLLIAHSCGRFRQWQPEEAELIQNIANQLAIAIQQASLYEQVQNELIARHEYERELEKQAASDRLLSEITIAISQSTDIDKTLDTYLNPVGQFLETDRIIIYQFQPNHPENYKGIVIKEAVSRVELSIIGTIITDSCFATTNLGEQYRKGKITKIFDTLTSNLDPCYLKLLQQFQVRSNLVIPILHSSQLWGLLILHQCDRPRHWQPWEISFLQQIATQIGTASQKEKLYLQLSSELSQKKILLKEIHHRVKNNLQVMSSILFLQFRNTPPEIKLLSEEYQNRIQAMSLIHEQLYRSDDLANIDFSNYIANLTSNLFQCYGTNQELIQTRVEVNNIFLPLDQAIPLGLIVNELVSNALKYAFPKMHGTIKIKLVQTDANIILTVSDDGVGIPADFDLANADGLGMQLIQSLTDQLDGEFSFDGTNGLMVQISFPHFQSG